MNAPEAIQARLKLQQELEQHFLLERAKLLELRTAVDDAMDRLDLFYGWIAKQLKIAALFAPPEPLMLKQIAAEFGVPMWEVETRKNSRQSVPVRHLAMSFYREMTGASLPATARVFSVHHTTVMHAIRETNKRMGDPEFKAHADKLRGELEG